MGLGEGENVGLEEKNGVAGDPGDGLVEGCGVTENGTGLGDDCEKNDTGGSSVVVTGKGLGVVNGLDEGMGLGEIRGGEVTGIGLGEPWGGGDVTGTGRGEACGTGLGEGRVII